MNSSPIAGTSTNMHMKHKLKGTDDEHEECALAAKSARDPGVSKGARERRVYPNQACASRRCEVRGQGERRAISHPGVTCTVLWENGVAVV